MGGLRATVQAGRRGTATNRSNRVLGRIPASTFEVPRRCRLFRPVLASRRAVEGVKLIQHWVSEEAELEIA